MIINYVDMECNRKTVYFKLNNGKNSVSLDLTKCDVVRMLEDTKHTTTPDLQKGLQTNISTGSRDTSDRRVIFWRNTTDKIYSKDGKIDREELNINNYDLFCYPPSVNKEKHVNIKTSPFVWSNGCYDKRNLREVKFLSTKLGMIVECNEVTSEPIQVSELESLLKYFE